MLIVETRRADYTATKVSFEEGIAFIHCTDGQVYRIHSDEIIKIEVLAV